MHEPRRSAPATPASGYIDAIRLRELWFHVGTACNLSCPFCLEGSRPGDTRLGLLRLRDVAPFVEEAVDLGVERFAFTGGEPLLAREFPSFLSLAASLRPCLVLSNGTAPLQRRLATLRPLLAAAHPVAFRISIDYPQAARHDAARGRGRFEEALSGLRALHELGFQVSVARQSPVGEDTAATDAQFRALFRARALPPDLDIVAFPDFHPPGATAMVPRITEQCMTAWHTSETRARFMCSTSRMVLKRDGAMRVYACTLVDDDPAFDLGGSLRASLARRVWLEHHRCYSCFKLGASCSGKQGPVPLELQRCATAIG